MKNLHKLLIGKDVCCACAHDLHVLYNSPETVSPLRGNGAYWPVMPNRVLKVLCEWMSIKRMLSTLYRLHSWLYNRLSAFSMSLFAARYGVSTTKQHMLCEM